MAGGEASKGTGMPADVVIGLDVGTQSSKLVACDATGGMLAEERVAHGVSRPGPGRFEQDAEAVWWGDVATLLLRLKERPDLRPRAVCVSAIGPTALPTDAEGRPLRPGILYGIDMRAQREIAELTARYGERETVAISGSAISTQSPVPKLLWLKTHEPDAFKATRRWFTAHSWLAWKLCGAYAIDHHSASQSVPLYDVAKAAWRSDIWSELLPGVAAPDLVWPGDVVGSITAGASEATGLPAGTLVVMGTVDAWSEAYSAYAESPGMAMIMYGSTFFFIANSDRFVASPRFWGTQSVRRGVYSLAGGMATGGLVLDWLARLFSTDVGVILKRVAEQPIAPDALLALPYFSGERTPFADPDVRAVLFGMDLDTGPDAICRAFVLGLALAVRDNLDAIREEGGGGRDYVAVGGGASAPAFLQIISDVGGIRQIVPHRTIGAALGDARLAAEAIGWETPQGAWNPTDRIAEPSPGARAAFDPMFARFKELYRLTKPLELPGG
jgi:xylulokinase